jgi:hypothetical protein
MVAFAPDAMQMFQQMMQQQQEQNRAALAAQQALLIQQQQLHTEEMKQQLVKMKLDLQQQVSDAISTRGSKAGSSVGTSRSVISTSLRDLPIEGRTDKMKRIA